MAPNPVAAAGPSDQPLFTRRFWLACAMHFTGAMATSFYILFPLFVRHLGGNEFVMGLYAGITGAAAVAARFPIGRFLDTQGRRRVLIAAGCLHVAAWLGFLSFDAIGLRTALLAAVYGLASGALFASYFTYASDIIPVTRRSEGFGLFGVWGIVTNGLGPMLAEVVIARAGFRAYFLVPAAFATVSLCISLLLPETAAMPRSPVAAPSAPFLRFVNRGLIFVLCTAFMFAAAVESLFVFLAPFAYAHGRGSIGGVFLCYALTAVAVRVFAGRLPDRVGLRRVLIPALFLYAAGIFLVPHVVGASTLIVVGMMCGAGHGYAFPILNALAIEQVSPAQRGRAVSWLTAMFDLGNTIANPILGALAQWAGYTVMFTASGVGMLLTAAVVWRRPVRQAR